VGQAQVSEDTSADATFQGMGIEWLHTHPWFTQRPGGRKGTPCFFLVYVLKPELSLKKKKTTKKQLGFV
jgi:hypothetical protein